MQLDDTIVAIATPLARGGLGMVRLSGGQARAIAERILRFPGAGAWRTWQARPAELTDAQGKVIDHTVATFFEAPHSYTAEDVVEICCHGSPVVLRHAVERSVESGARLAEPGEFTLRAFLRGRIDLPQAEAVRDLIEATTMYQARVAAQQSSGSVSRRLAPIKEKLLELIALLEAGIDFADDDVSVAPDEAVLSRLAAVEAGVSELAQSFQFGALVREGLSLAIVGRPNVGKSSLFNRLLEQDRAIVTDIPGTTRDVVSETAAIAGIPIKLHDTAGIRAPAGTVEALGIERSFQLMADADLTLVVLDASSAPEAEDQRLIERARSAAPAIVVANKSDLPDAAAPFTDAILVSAVTGDGIERLRQAILNAVAPAGVFEPETGFITSLRHEQLLRECGRWLEKSRGAVGAGIPHEMLLLDLYAALQPLDAITGGTTADDILNRIFSKFCIGK